MGGEVNKDTLCILCIFAVGEVNAILFLFHCCAKTCTRSSAGEQGNAMQGYNKNTKEQNRSKNIALLCKTGTDQPTAGEQTVRTLVLS